MPNISQWLGNQQKGNDWKNDIEVNRAVHFTDVIMQLTPVQIVLRRPKPDEATLPAQTVRIEMQRIEPDPKVGIPSRAATYNALIFGYDDHPQFGTLDIRHGDKFTYKNQLFSVTVVYVSTPGIKQAWAEAMV
jgi:hypothetical protein